MCRVCDDILDSILESSPEPLWCERGVDETLFKPLHFVGVASLGGFLENASLLQPEVEIPSLMGFGSGIYITSEHE